MSYIDPSVSRDPRLDTRGIQSLARTMYRELRTQGYSSSQIIDFSSEMIELVRSQMRAEARPSRF